MSDWNVLKPSDSSNKNVGTLSGSELTFGVSEIDWSHYKHPLPEYVYANYMQCWESVHLLEREIPQDVLKAHKVRVAQPSAGLSLA
jgi:hypothetical protein